MPSTIEEDFRQWLNLYWLRPENALLVTWKSQVFRDIPFPGPSLEISCGDGMFMFVHAGGRFSPGFDYFQSTRAREFSHGSEVDIYDAYKEGYHVEIERKPDFLFDCGTDWKQALLDKAGALNLYRKLVLHDNNITPLPFGDEQFQSIYSNSLEWTPNTLDLLREVRRILKPGGHAAIAATTGSLYATLHDLKPLLSEKAVSILDRGRIANAAAARPISEWKQLVAQAGLKLKELRVIWPSRLIIDIWNIGLRPISHLLIQMADQLPLEERLRIKKEWVDTFFELGRPLLDQKVTYDENEAPYVLLVLSK